MAKKTVERKILLEVLREDGWYYVRTKGSHHHYKHETKKGTVTVKKKIPTFCKWMLKSIEDQSGIKF